MPDGALQKPEADVLAVLEASLKEELLAQADAEQGRPSGGCGLDVRKARPEAFHGGSERADAGEDHAIRPTKIALDAALVAEELDRLLHGPEVAHAVV